MTTVRGSSGFDKRRLVPGRNPAPLPETVDVVVVGAGLLGLVTAARLQAAGRSCVVLEKRAVVGGIWSMYANSTSQVNSSEGAYCFKELLGEDLSAANRDHSPASEVLTDLHKLA